MGTRSSDYAMRIWDGTSDSVGEILPILQEYMGPHTTREWCTYKFATKEIPTFAALADAGGKTVGIAASSTQRFTGPGVNLLGTVSVATYVHPDHRGHGLYPRLLAELQEAAESRGISFQIALPNSGSRRSFEKAGYRHSGDSVERISFTNPRMAIRAIRSVRFLTNFTPSTRCSNISHSNFRLFSAANESSHFIQSDLSSDFLSYRLDARRQHYYSIDDCNGYKVVLMHGFRGSLKEARILASSPRVTTGAQRRELQRALVEIYGVDIVSERFTTFSPPALAFDGLTISRRANPPMYVGSTSVSNSSLNSRGIRLTGIDTHTW